jgi:hypoxanthine phosphoribosyltransferase
MNLSELYRSTNTTMHIQIKYVSKSSPKPKPLLIHGTQIKSCTQLEVYKKQNKIWNWFMEEWEIYLTDQVVLEKIMW